MDRFYHHRFGLKLAAGISASLGIIGIILITTGSSGHNPSSLLELESHGPAIRTLWPDGLIPYILDSNLDEKSVEVILSAVKIVEEKTCINFIGKEKSDKNWVQFVRNALICSDSPLGLDISRTGMRKIEIGQNCFNSSIVQRMLGRILGLDYEETRPDRDKFIRYEPGCENFSKTNISVEIPIGDHHEAALGIFFDYSSHMFRRRVCLEPILNGQINFGSADDENTGTLSVLDMEKLNAMYNCSGCESYRFVSSNKVFGPLTTYESFQPFVVGGMDLIGLTPLYICRIYRRGEIVVGKLHYYINNSGNRVTKCWIGDWGSEHGFDSDHEVLTNVGGANLVWKQRDASFIPQNAIAGGRTQDRDPIYIGRCRLIYFGREAVVTGSIFINNSVFMVPFNHMTIPCPPSRQEILVCNE